VKIRVVLAVTMLAATAAFWWRTSGFGFSCMDDDDYVVRNEHVQAGLTVASMKWAFCEVGYAANWHPFAWLSLMADVSVAGDSESQPRVMHLHNALLHAANAALLLLLALGMAGRWEQDDKVAGRHDPGRSWGVILAAGIVAAWAVHPLRAEVVCWVSERKELLSVFFMLLSLLVYFRWRGRWGLCATLLLFAFALMAKPVAVTLPVVVLAGDCACGRKPRWRVFLAFAVLAAVCVGFTLVAQRGAMPSRMDVPYGMRIVNAVTSYGVYLWQTVAPVRLAAFYPFPGSLDAPFFVLGCGVLLGAGTVCTMWIAGRRGPIAGLFLLCVAWCVVGLVPMIGIVQVGSQAHADRYTYWVGCGLVVCLARMMALAGRRVSRLALCVLTAAVPVYAVLGWRQMGVWRDAEEVCRSAYEANGSALSAYYWGECLIKSDRVKAEALLRESIAKHVMWDSCSALGILLATKRDTDLDEAEKIASIALKLNPADRTSREALGIVAMRRRDYAAAEKHFSKACEGAHPNPMIERMLEEARKKLKEGVQTGPIREPM